MAQFPWALDWAWPKEWPAAEPAKPPPVPVTDDAAECSPVLSEKAAAREDEQRRIRAVAIRHRFAEAHSGQERPRTDRLEDTLRPYTRY